MPGIGRAIPKSLELGTGELTLRRGRSGLLRAALPRSTAIESAPLHEIAPGSSLGHYEVSSFLGKGGMGEVWRARDTRLDRDVALKVPARGVRRRSQRLARFQREAKSSPR